MVGNTFGTIFRVSSFGESHGSALGVLIDGCPAGLELDLGLISKELERRRPGQSRLVTPRKESDEFEILSGIFEGKTTGMPLCFVVANKDVKSKDYSNIKDLFRPGHADFTYFAKYRHRDYRGGGRSSARETVARVIAGAVAKQLLQEMCGTSFRGAVTQVGNVKAKNFVWEQAEENELRCVDPDQIEPMREEIVRAQKARDSVGGVVEVQALSVPPGLGEPVFGKLDAAIAGAMLSIPAVKGLEIGAGFSSVSLRGSEMQDEMTPEGFLGNNHGGILGGISSGAPIVVRIAIKPTSSIAQPKQSIDTQFASASVATKGRHDPCVALRAVPIAEAMLALVLIDYYLQDAAQREARSSFSPISPIRYGLCASDKGEDGGE